MRRFWLLVLLFASTLGRAQATDDLFDSFILRPAEVPAGFQLELEQGEIFRELGLSGNPGTASADSPFVAHLYDHPDRASISKAQVEIYIKGEDRELGVFSIEYRSPAALQNELTKLRHSGDKHFLWKDRYLVIVWSDAGTFSKQVNKLAGQLQQRLGLTTYVPVLEEDVPSESALPAE